jgi:very-short-patch-repair endonuclease
MTIPRNTIRRSSQQWNERRPPVIDATPRERLIDLIDYVAATERDRMAVTLDIAQHGLLREDGEDVIKLPGVRIDARGENDHVWLSVDRLARDTPPPPSDARLRVWAEIADDPERKPVLRDGINGTAGRTLLAALPERSALDAAFAAYMREIWSPWALEERPRRRAIALYNGLFALRQALDGAAEQPLELVWGIGIARWTHPRGRVRHPLLTVPLEIAIDPASHAIEIRARSEALPGIESDPFDALDVPATDEWRRFARAQLETLDGDGLSPFVEQSFAPILRRAVALLDADGHYLPDLGDRRAPADGTLQVSGGWTIFARVRRATHLMDDLQRFRASIEAMGADETLPAAVDVLFTEPDAAPPAEHHHAYRGVSTVPGITSVDGSGDDLFFPKPFNREQVEVIQRLAARPGVVVQGPPGTGKTHTIGNIVSHYLALGKRVLVTSQKAPALKVLRGQLPAAVRPLAVSLLESDRDGLKQFQESVDTIAERLHRSRPSEMRAEIAVIDTRIDALHRRLAAIDALVGEIGRTAMTPVEIDGERIDPATAARSVVAAGDLADWLPDAIDTIRSHEPPIDDDEMATLRAARKAAGKRIACVDFALPSPAALPDAEAIVAIHRDLRAADALDRAAGAGETLADKGDANAIAGAMAALRALEVQGAALADAGIDWTDAVLRRTRRGEEDASLVALTDLTPLIDKAVIEQRHFITRPVTLPDGAVEDAPLREAIMGLARGGELGFLSGLFARTMRQRIGAIRLSGRAPATPEDWGEVLRHLIAADAAGQLLAVWNHVAGHGLVAAVEDRGLASVGAMQTQLAHLAAIRAHVAAERTTEAELRRLLPALRPSVADKASRAELIALLDRHLRRARLSGAATSRDDLRRVTTGIPGEVGASLATVAKLLGDAGCDEVALREAWQAALDELGALRTLAPAFETIRRLAAEIAEGGAPIWAERLRTEPVIGIEDAWTPGDWRARWRLRRLATWLRRIDRQDRLAGANAERRDLEAQLRSAYEAAIEERTWCRLAEKASDHVRAALAAYAQAMRKIGRGTGVRAGRYRADARAAADRAKNALPCWIMPHYRVSESLPAELGLFDLVIVDEASQSTVAALPALLRARQVLIVGDDRQVSPDAGFREEARLNALAARHLGRQVDAYRAAMREDKSLYDLGTVAFAGGAIMLKEHFRCVAPIIEFSKAQFYSHQLVPLRLPAASERLDPPLVDIVVEDGFRHGKVNPPEVACIVDEISRIVTDPMMAGRTIGVTTLLGIEQARAIIEAIERGIGTEAMLAHDIRVGEPSAFQGDERDIMFVSMVAVRGSGALTGLGQEQRFNVAASRARDRMVLVRSVELDDLSAADKLRRALIEHFHAPFAGDGALAQDRRARCESAFETAMFDLLTERGYRVDTQVCVGTKRIDLVVEGGDDRRLAIECDGDAFHGADRWPDDMARQRMLERAGWAVWRCFASRFVRERDAVIAELVAVLGALGIAPDAHGDHAPSRHTDHRRWRSAPPEPEGPPVPYAWLVPATDTGDDLARSPHVQPITGAAA